MGYGTPDGYTDAIGRKNEMSAVGTAIGEMMVDIQASNPDISMSSTIKRAWNSCVDESVKPHVTAVFVVPESDCTEVIVYVDTSIWATELNMQSELLRFKLNAELERLLSAWGTRRAGDEEYTHEQVKKLRFVVSKEKYVRASQNRTSFSQLEQTESYYDAIKPIELTQDEVDEIQEVVSCIDDDKLREAILGAAKANLAWQKGLRAS